MADLKLRARVRATLIVCLLACSAGLFATGPAANASRGEARLAQRVPFGIGDQDPAIFWDPRFIWLGIRSARFVTPWDTMRHHKDLERAEQWLEAAHAAGIEPLVAFNQSTNHQHLLPTVGSYSGAVRAFMHRFPWVNHYQTWNEENQAAQPTSRDPAQAARYFNWLNRACRKCAVTAVDLLDGKSMVGWLRTFLKYARGARIWGFHPYFELHQGGAERLNELEHMVHGQIWFTEAGLPLWRYQRNMRHFHFTSMREQVTAVKRLLGFVRKSARITRIYYYQWRSPFSYQHALSQFRHHHTVESSWDSGLLNPNCSVRPTFKVVAKALGRGTSHIPPARLSHNHFECLAPPLPNKESTGNGGSSSG